MMKETLNNSREGERRLYRSSPELACLKISAVKAAIAAMLMVLLLVPSGFAQLRTSKPKKGPRAIAVVRWQTGPQGKAVPRLVPVLIVEEGKYFDANLFRAAPRPMALEPGVVYEAQDQGDV
ncbi:MAG TPA: hypothetical protein VMZ25_03615, partial [Terriglobales bacterium]|nr:hypothetical protein [Terriglobales bacterium]